MVCTPVWNGHRTSKVAGARWLSPGLGIVSSTVLGGVFFLDPVLTLTFKGTLISGHMLNSLRTRAAGLLGSIHLFVTETVPARMSTRLRLKYLKLPNP